MAYKFGYDFKKLRQNIKTVDAVPFSSARKTMSAICKLEDGKKVMFSKGAPDFLIKSCTKFMDRNGEAQPIDSEFKNILAYNLS